MLTYHLKADITNNRYILLKNDTTFELSKILYDILVMYKENQNTTHIANFLEQKHKSSEYTPQFVSQALKVVFEKLALINAKPQLEDFLHAKIVLVKEGALNTIYNLLSNFFRRNIFITVILISSFITFYFFYYNDILDTAAINNALIEHLNFTELMLSYLLFLCIIMAHELGHAAATTYYKLKPKEIGFGIYFIFPVFYTNVSAIWQLSTYKRNIVNLGGIYFQLLINVILIGLFFIDETASLVFNLIVVNTISMLFSLNPFFRYDGYWILSDTLNIPNLTYKAKNLTIAVLSSPIKTFKNLEKKDAFVFIYSLLSFFFWIYVYYQVILFFRYNLPLLFTKIQTGLVVMDNKEIFDFCLNILSIFLIAFFIVTHFISVIKTIKNVLKSIS